MTSSPRWIETGAGSCALVCLHGISSAASGWAGLLPGLARPGWRALAWDMPGYGASPTLDPYDFPGLARAVVEMLDAAGLEQAVLVGHSLGGMIALQTAADFPDRVSGLVLACCTPAFGAPSGAAQEAFLTRRLGALDRGGSMADLAADLIPAMAAPGTAPALLAAATELMDRIPPESYRAAMHALVRFDQRAALPHIQAPTLCLAGELDTVSTPLVVRRMAERMPAASYVEMPGAGHLAPFEQPAEFVAQVRAFLESLAA